MKNLKIVKLVIVGHFIINVPIILVTLIGLNFVNVINKTSFFSILTISFFFYWSYLIPCYKMFAIKHLTNKKEFNLWYQISSLSLLFWSNNCFLTQLENWKKNDLALFKEKRNEILNN